MLLKCFYKHLKQKTEEHHYYEIHIENGYQLVFKKYYNTNIYTFDKVLEDIKQYDITKARYTIKRIKMSKEKYLDLIYTFCNV